MLYPHEFTRRAFRPEPDITTFELAEIVSPMATNGNAPFGGIDFTDEIWDSLPSGIKRHFKEMAELPAR